MNLATPVMGDTPISPITIKQVQKEYDEHYAHLMDPRPEKGYYVYNSPVLTPLFMGLVQNLHMGERAATLLTAADKGHVVHEHRDKKVPGPIRYHLPIYTEHTTLWEDGEPIHMYEGAWYGPISYWLPHWVEHEGDHQRVHLIVDFD